MLQKRQTPAAVFAYRQYSHSGFAAGGFSKSKALAFNFLTAATAVLGAIVSLFLSESVTGLTAFLIPFAAGTFIYIAGSDLIPELHKEVNFKKSFIQLTTFIIGIMIMVLLILLD